MKDVEFVKQYEIERTHKVSRFYSLRSEHISHDKIKSIYTKIFKLEDDGLWGLSDKVLCGYYIFCINQRGDLGLDVEEKDCLSALLNVLKTILAFESYMEFVCVDVSIYQKLFSLVELKQTHNWGDQNGVMMLGDFQMLRRDYYLSQKILQEIELQARSTSCLKHNVEDYNNLLSINVEDPQNYLVFQVLKQSYSKLCAKRAEVADIEELAGIEALNEGKNYFQSRFYKIKHVLFCILVVIGIVWILLM